KRQVTNAAGLVDPKETLTAPGTTGNVFVPFHSVSGKVESGSRSEFFDASTTNEIPYARTRGDGTGLEYFEIQRVMGGAALGGGEPQTVKGAVVGRPCWLVIVPRGNHEVDGTTRSGLGAFPLDSSPLSQTNWDNRLAVRLRFEPVGQACPFQNER